MTDTGFLVLADISGFTAFVTESELEHGATVTGALLDTVMHRLAPPLEVQELEGDAVFAVGSDRVVPDGTVLPGLLVGSFDAFKTRQHRLMEENDCECRACSGIGRLSLKLVAHHGAFVRQSIGGRGRLAGPDVILVHRLLKNPLRADAYLLLTEPALRRVGDLPADRDVQRHRLSYPYLGDVSCVAVLLGGGPDRRRAEVALPAA